MRILLTGATGFIGRRLVARLAREGHALTAWVRSAQKARASLGAALALIETAGGASALTAAVNGADAIINLAGEPIAGGRWTQRRRRQIEQSRVGVTAALVQAIAAADRRPKVLLSASAVGYYGDRGDQLLDEESPAGQGFLSEICQAWEQAASAAEALQVRVLRLRQGVVLGPGGGFIDRLLPLARWGLAPPLGTGKQFVPWIHLDDLLELWVRALTDARASGVVNVVAPQPVRMTELMRALTRAAGGARRWSLPAVPGFALRAVLGQAADVVLGSQRLDGEKLRRWSDEGRTRLSYPGLDLALAQIALPTINATRTFSP